MPRCANTDDLTSLARRLPAQELVQRVVVPDQLFGERDAVEQPLALIAIELLGGALHLGKVLGDDPGPRLAQADST